MDFSLILKNPERRLLDAIGAISAEGTEWQTGALCSNSGFDFIPDVETDAGVNEAQQWCRTCPVRTTCLAWAMLHSTEGYWGGTTTYQRNQLRRVRTRAKDRGFTNRLAALSLGVEKVATEKAKRGLFP